MPKKKQLPPDSFKQALIEGRDEILRELRALRRDMIEAFGYNGKIEDCQTWQKRIKEKWCLQD